MTSQLITAQVCLHAVAAARQRVGVAAVIERTQTTTAKHGTRDVLLFKTLVELRTFDHKVVKGLKLWY